MKTLHPLSPSPQCGEGVTKPPHPLSPFPQCKERVAKPGVRFWLVMILAIASLLLASPVAATELSITVNDINFGIVGEDEFLAGYALVPAHAIFLESDIPWRVTVRSLDPDLGMSDDGMYIKPLGNLLWKLTDEQSWQPMAQEPEEVDWSVDTGEGLVLVDFVVILDWEKDVPGEYEARIVFSIESL
jgi:hypothetical protein